MACDTTSLERVSSRLEKIESLLERIQENTHQTDDIKHVTRKSVDPTLQKVMVGIRTNILNIGDIDGVRQEFKAKLYLGAKWREPALKGKTQDSVRWDDTWEPRIVFFNCVTMESKTKKCYLEYDDGDDIPYVRLSYTIRGIFKEKMELKDFPFDVQELSIILLADWPLREVEFQKNMEIKDSIRLESFDASQSWTLKDIVYSRPQKDAKTKVGSHKEYPKYCISAYVVRKPGYYIWNILLVMGIIMVLTFSSLSVEPGSPADRLSVTLTLLLTSVAFKFVVSQSLPEISYVTALDMYVLFCMMFQCLMVVQNSVASLFPESSARTFDWICAAVMGGIVVLFHIYWLLHVGLKIRRRNNRLRELKQDYDILCEDINQAWLKRREQKQRRDLCNKQPAKTKNASLLPSLPMRSAKVDISKRHSNSTALDSEGDDMSSHTSTTESTADMEQENTRRNAYFK